MYCIVLYCIVLYCIVLYCIVLYCGVLYCIVLQSLTNKYMFKLRWRLSQWLRWIMEKIAIFRTDFVYKNNILYLNLQIKVCISSLLHPREI